MYVHVCSYTLVIVSSQTRRTRETGFGSCNGRNRIKEESDPSPLDSNVDDVFQEGDRLVGLDI